MNEVEQPLNFKQAFCAKYQCRPEDYIKTALLRSYYQHSTLVVRVLYWLHTKSVRESIQAIEALGYATDITEARRILADYRYQLKMHQVSFWVKLLRVRLSGRNVLRLFAELESTIGASCRPMPALSRADRA